MLKISKEFSKKYIYNVYVLNKVSLNEKMFNSFLLLVECPQNIALVL